ncbi:OV-16 antigen-like protein [Hapsidospora chrysogenum ATCC 11550]|uniref:OV-16 antigen-like protein n=1 Tax=Hapsidospora chrysogenum (strain ATCC 11550 / CBS 779.69 / DSM 880 / IAM 14645 / JCM 23072 / IMI 49137) TaxID=857340 RepID=A0A086THD0_HAPC1|nr:OV-16 antigen-like protein [Hapsidospora chrysogenum ATCC 11550]
MALEEHASALLSTLEKAKLVPGSAESLIPPGFKPTTKLGIAFHERQVELGNLFRTSECKSPPSITFEPENANEGECVYKDGVSGASYMLLLVDPDAPTPDDPKFAFWRHWILPGLQPAGQAAATQTKAPLTAYLGPGPKDDSKPHRYLFLLFREPEGLALSEDDVGGEEFVQRRSFDPASFVSKHGLSLAGVNWMLGAGDGWSE